MKKHTKESLIEAIREDEAWHFNRCNILTLSQWLTMIAVALAGALTAFASTAPARETFMAWPGSLLVVGIVAAVGAVINQGVNFSQRIAKHRKAALGHKIVVEGLRFGGLSKERALDIRKQVFNNPEKALEVISKPAG